LINVEAGQRRLGAHLTSSRGIRWRIGIAGLLALALVFGGFEAYRAYGFYSDLRAARGSLLSLQDDLDLESLEDSEADVLSTRSQLEQALVRADAAGRFVENDPVLGLARHVPFLDKQADGLAGLVDAAEDATRTGLLAADVALAFARQSDQPDRTAVQEALAFLEAQREPMQAVEAGLVELQASHAALPTGLIGPLDTAKTQLGEALEKLEALVTGYNRAESFLPALLGYDGQASYLVLPQNDTELFPSGGLISSYGIATFIDGDLQEMEFEYFEALYERWQTQSGGEYIEPPAPLANYLKQGYSWALGEAGWYPDFPTTSRLASDFVQKGGAPATDGTIAIDTYFIRTLLDELGAVYVPEYDVTVDFDNFQELTLELTRDEWDVPVEDQKAFLSDLSKALLARIFSTPKEEWVNLLGVLERMARERHLQIHLNDADMQTLAVAYGLDGSIERPEGGDYLLVADTSVNSTKLNMILETAVEIDLSLQPDGTAAKTVSYSITNPFPAWAEGRDPELVARLMFNGLYGSYLRVYAPKGSTLKDVRFGGQTVGPEAIETEFGYTTFGRYFPVLPGTSAKLDVMYETPGTVVAEGNLRTYRLYVQKEAGTEAVPLTLNLSLPEGARLEALTLDEEPSAGGLTVKADLRTDRMIEVTYRLR
jgi:hypothetical protein